MDRRRAAGALLALAACIACSSSAPMAGNQTALDLYDGAPEGCYYNFQHYGEGDRIMTNEPCLNCTCHNRMLMCYLRVCPFTKPIGQDCTVEKRADQCCPIVTCPDVPVDLLTSTSTSSPAEYGATGIGKHDKYGCSINGRYFSEGSKVPSTPNKPCEHCYCIRNMTTCVMQECTLHVDGCVPIYHKDVCCPVRYSCDHPEDEVLLLDDMTTTVRPTPGFLLTTTTLAPVTQVSQDCVHDDQIFADGALIKTEKACEHCYCMKGDIVCVVQECGTPMENEGKNCTSLPPRQGQCCPDTYICEGDELATDQVQEVTTEETLKTTSTLPPRRGTEGSGYRNEPDEPYTGMPLFDTVDTEGSGEDQSTMPLDQSEQVTSEKQTPDFADEMFLTTAKQSESKPFTTTTETVDIDHTMVSKSETLGSEITSTHENEMATESVKPNVSEEEEKIDSEYKVTQEPYTTFNDYLPSSISDGLTSREVQFDKTTESTFRKEDDIVSPSEVTSQKTLDEITTQNEYYEQKLTTEGIAPVTSTSIIHDKDDDFKLDTTKSHSVNEDILLSKHTTTEISATVETNKEEIDNTHEYSSSTTLRNEFLETTSLNSIENEIVEDVPSIIPPGRIPGEGDCLLNGITYKNYTTVPSTNKCHTSCKCVSSIVKCDPIICSPPPEYANMNNCEPIYDSAESCCPTYICDQSKEGILPESHSQMSGTESPKPTHSDECSGNECPVTEDKHTVAPIQSEPLPEKQPERSECGIEGCDTANTSPPIKKSEECADGICEVSSPDLLCDKNTGCQVTAVRPCEGEDCSVQLDVIDKDVHSPCQDKDNCNDIITVETDKTSCKDGICTPILSPENQNDAVEKECINDACRRKESADVAATLPHLCTGEDCKPKAETEKIQPESTTELPIISDESTETSYKDMPTTISSEHYSSKTDEKQTTILEAETTSTYGTSTNKKIDLEVQEFTTEHSKPVQEIIDSDVTKELEPFTSARPEVERIPDDLSSGTLDIRTTIPDIREEEYLTTFSHNLMTEPTISEEKTDSQENNAEIEKQETTELPVSDVGSHQTSTFDEEKLTTISHESPDSNSKEYAIYDEDKNTGTIESHIEDTTSALPSNTNIVDSYTTESVISKEESEKEDHKKYSSTMASIAHDDAHTTETLQIKEIDDTTSMLLTEYSTSLPQSEVFDVKETSGSTLESTEKSVEYEATTKTPEDTLAMKAEEKVTPADSNTLLTVIDQETTTEYNKELETFEDKHTTEESLKETITTNTAAEKHEMTGATPDLHHVEKEYQETTETVQYTTEKAILDVKDTNEDVSLTEIPVTESAYVDENSKTTLQDVIEALNGRGTEVPNVDVLHDLQTVTPHSHETDIDTTKLIEIATGIDQTESELASTEKTSYTSQKTFEHDIETKIPPQYETVEIVTEATTVAITEPARINDVSTVVNQELSDNKDKEYTTNILQEITTVKIDEIDTLAEKDNKEKDTEPIVEVTKKLEPLSTTESIADSVTTDYSIESTDSAGTHISQSDSTATPLHVSEHTVAVQHDIELSTVVPDLEIKTESLGESSIDTTKQPEKQDMEHEYHTSVSTTYKQDSPVSTTAIVSETTENIPQQSTLTQKDDTTESSAISDTEYKPVELSPPSSSVDHDTLVTVSLEKEITTKLADIEEIITESPDLTTKYVDSTRTDEEKTTVVTHSSEKSTSDHEDETTKIYLKPENEFSEEVTVVPEILVTETPHFTYIDSVTHKDSGIAILEDIKPTTDISEMLTSNIADTEQEMVTENLGINAVTDEEKEITEEHEKPNIEKTTEILDLITHTKQESGIIGISQTTHDIIETTEPSDLSTEEKNKSDLTTLKPLEMNNEVSENIVNIEETDVTEKYTTESPVKDTDIEDFKKQTLIPEILATVQVAQEPFTEKILSTPEIKYTDKITESPEKTEYTNAGFTELSEDTSKIPDDSVVMHDTESSTENRNEVTVPELVLVSSETTGPAYVDEILKVTTRPDELGTRQPSNVDESDTEKDFITDKAVTWSLESGTEKLPESHILDESEKSTLAENIVTKDELITDKPLFVTESIKDGENIHDNQKDINIPKDTATPPSKLLDHPAEVTEPSEIDRDTATMKPEKSTLEDTAIISEHTKETVSTEAPELYVPVQTSSYLPEKSAGDEQGVTVSDETDIEHSEFSTPRPSESKDIDRTGITTESVEMLTTSKSFESLDKVELTATTVSSFTTDIEKLSVGLPITELVSTDISQESDKEETITDLPAAFTTKYSETDLPKFTTPKAEHEVITEIQPLPGHETSTKIESIEITSEKEFPDIVKVNVEGEDKTTAYIPDQYTEIPELTTTEWHRLSTISPEYLTERDVAVTDKSDVATLFPDKPLTTIIKDEQTYPHDYEKHDTYTTVPESLVTKKIESETQLPITLYTTSQSEGLITEHVSDGQTDVTKAPTHEYTSESDNLTTAIFHEQTVNKEIMQTDMPVTDITLRDENIEVTEKIDDESLNEAKETKPNYTATEKIESTTKFDEEVKVPTESNTSDESKLPEYSDQTSGPKEEYSESTPHFVELEEHTYKSEQEVTPEIYNEGAISTIKPDTIYSEKEQDEITTQKQNIDEEENYTEKAHKEIEDSTKEDSVEVTTSSLTNEVVTQDNAEVIHEMPTERPIQHEKLTTPSILVTEIHDDVTKHTFTTHEKDTPEFVPADTTASYDKEETPKLGEPVIVTEQEKESDVTSKPYDSVTSVHEATAPEEEFIPAVTKSTTTIITEDVATLSPTHTDKFTGPEDKPIESVSSTSSPELQKPGFNEMLPTDDIPSTDEDSHFPPTGSSGYGQETDYGEEDQAFGPGTCRYGGKVYVSAQQIPRDDPCDFCFCFRSDIICLQQSCPPPIHGCHEEPIQGFCCPRYECPVSMATTLNITTTTTTTTTTLPPHFLPHAYKGAAQRRGCQIKGHTYKVGEVVRASSGPCLHCTCGGDGQMKCDPKACTPEPMLRQMIAAAVSAKRRR